MKLKLALHQPQFAGASDRFRAPLNLQFDENPTVMSLDRIQSEEELLADFAVRQPLRDELEDFKLAVAQWLGERLRRAQGNRRGCASLVAVEYRDQLLDVFGRDSTRSRASGSCGSSQVVMTRCSCGGKCSSKKVKALSIALASIR